MKQLIIILSASIAFFSCTSTRTLNEQPIVSVVKNTCIAPAPQFVPEGFDASAEVVLPQIEQALNADVSIGQKVNKIRKITPEVYNFQVMEYSLCQSVEQGRIDKASYQEFLRTMIERIFSNVPDNTALKITCLSKTTKQPIAGARIAVGDLATARTDANGEALLKIPRSVIGKQVQLTASYIGQAPLKDNITIEGPMTQVNIFV